MRVYLIYSKLVFFQQKLLKKQTDLKKKKKKKKKKQTKTVHVNSASETALFTWTVQFTEQCAHHRLKLSCKSTKILLLKNRGPAAYKWRDPCVLIRITFVTKRPFMRF
jgi:hypothetical protein